MSIRKKYLVFLSLFLILAIIFSYLCNCENRLTLSNYNLSTDKIKNPIKLVFISDLHNREFGENNIDLVTSVAEQKPDLIAVGGDMITMTDNSHDKFISLLQQLTEIAPTYYALGNHEKSYKNLDSLINDVKYTDATFLDNSMEKIAVNDETITIGGLTSFPYYENYYPDFENKERYFLDAFEAQEQDNYTILLAHQPEFYFWTWGLKEKNIDLILSGHTHGGVVQVPFIGGLYAPNQGFFPEYDKGFFSSGTANMIITSGLGNTVPIPRINNEPEICIININ